MSNTPRTDAAEVDNSEFSDWGCGPSGFCHREAMEELELELVAQTKRAEKWKECAISLEPLCEDLIPVRTFQALMAEEHAIQQLRDTLAKES